MNEATRNAGPDIKQEVRQFYDQVGWKLVGNEVYQNARFEDLRPVAQRYIHDCHLRVSRHIAPTGRFLLDAGSGPVQYPEYLEYSRGYQYRVCADISFTALQEARHRLGDKGLFVVADVANLPFKSGTFEGVVSLHTIHHLHEDEHLSAYRELFRVLAPEKSAVVVNGWSHSTLMKRSEPLIRIANSLRSFIYRIKGERLSDDMEDELKKGRAKGKRAGKSPRGTFTHKHNARWVRAEVGRLMPVEILVWRSVTVRFMRALIHPALGGRLWLRCIYAVEELFPHYYGVVGKYPLIVIRKTKEAG